MGEVVPAHTSLPLHPPSPPTVLWFPCLKCLSASIVVTSTLRINLCIVRSIALKMHAIHQLYFADYFRQSGRPSIDTIAHMLFEGMKMPDFTNDEQNQIR